MVAMDAYESVAACYTPPNCDNGKTRHDLLNQKWHEWVDGYDSRKFRKKMVGYLGTEKWIVIGEYLFWRSALNRCFGEFFG